eukprot:1147814-Pelagomonas_calceolata.AAC.2
MPWLPGAGHKLTNAYSCQRRVDMHASHTLSSESERALLPHFQTRELGACTSTLRAVEAAAYTRKKKWNAKAQFNINS